MTRRATTFSQSDPIMDANFSRLLRDPEDRRVSSDDEAAIREKMLDKTLADSYPASDPPSSLPNPSVDSLSRPGGERAPGERAA